MMFPSINISRDALQPAENLEGYVTRQLDALAQGLKGWALKSREPATLGDGLTAGEWVRASYLRDGKRIWQNQAVFALAEGRVLVFTLAMARKLTRGRRAAAAGAEQLPGGITMNSSRKRNLR